ncbi:hypothetical protein BASA81_004060 [Batrachochytrium salamandrivorans]|nr:hypothetical protein BASA81_004060 [Batrachochytrium salamandrivorans]
MMNSEPPDKHRSIKQSLKNVVRDPASQRTILDVVHASHRITVHALQFLKLRSERQESGHQETRGRRCNSDTLLLKQKLLEFHREHYKLTMTDPKEKLGFTNKAQLLQYIAVDVVKDYENNLKLHFVQHLIRFLEFVYKKSEVMATGEQAGTRQAVRRSPSSPRLCPFSAKGVQQTSQAEWPGGGTCDAAASGGSYETHRPAAPVSRGQCALRHSVLSSGLLALCT